MDNDIIIQTRNVNFYYGSFRALTDVTMNFEKNRVTALIGPSGCGKSTLLRLLNRMNDLIDGTRVEGEILFEGKNIYEANVDPVEIRKRIGMVFQKPNPFPKSTLNNIVYGPRLAGTQNKRTWNPWWKRASNRPPSGKRPRTSWVSRPWRSRGDSSNGSASPGPWP